MKGGEGKEQKFAGKHTTKLKGGEHGTFNRKNIENKRNI